MSVQGILGKKIGMTQVFDDKGEVHPGHRSEGRPLRNHTAQDLGEGRIRRRADRLRRLHQGFEGEQGHDRPLCQVECSPVRVLREVEIETGAAPKEGEGESNGVKAGDRILVDIFSDEKFVDVIGTSEGARLCWCDSASLLWWRPQVARSYVQVQGSIGASSFPSRVFPGQRMPGHMGHEQSNGSQPPHSRHRSGRQPPVGRGVQFLGRVMVMF